MLRAEPNFIKNCESLEKRLVDAMREAAEKLNRVSASPQQALANVASKNNFLEALDVKSNRYVNNIKNYCQRRLCDEIKTEAEFDEIFSDSFPKEAKLLGEDSEIVDLFRHPYQAMGTAQSNPFTLKRYFGFKVNNENYNFDHYLMMIYKLNLMQKYALNVHADQQRLLNQYHKLHLEIANFEALLQDGNEQQLSDLVKTHEVPSLAEAHSDVDPEDQNIFQFMDDDTFEPLRRYGNVIPSFVPWAAYWGPFLTDLRYLEYYFHPLQMKYPYLYPWKERVAYFLLGSDVRKYLKDNYRWLSDGVNLFIDITRDFYNKGSVTFSEVSGISWMASNLVGMLLNDVPLALIKGISSLPTRLLRGLANKMTVAGSTSNNRLSGFFDAIDVLFTVTLYSGVRIPLFAILIPVRAAIALATLIVYPVLMMVAHYVIRPIINILRPNPDKRRQLNNALFRLRSIVLEEVANDHRYTENQINDLMPIHAALLDDAIRSAKSVQWLKRFIQKKQSFLFSRHPKLGSGNNKRMCYLVVGEVHQVYSSCSPTGLLADDSVESLTVDWNFYQGSTKPSSDEMKELIEALSNRTAPLKKLRLCAHSMNDESIEKIIDCLIENKYVNPEMVSFESKLASPALLLSLLRLVQQKPSIKYVLSLPGDINQLGNEHKAYYEHIQEQLENNRKNKQPEWLMRANDSVVTRVKPAPAAGSLRQHMLLNHNRRRTRTMFMRPSLLNREARTSTLPRPRRSGY